VEKTRGFIARCVPNDLPLFAQFALINGWLSSGQGVTFLRWEEGKWFEFQLFGHIFPVKNEENDFNAFIR